MATRTIIRGDTYALRRPLYTYALVDTNNNPFNLTGCTIRTTFKAAPTDPSDDPNDATAAIKHTIIINGSGVATTTTGLYLVTNAASGQIKEYLTAAESRILPVGVDLVSDVELTDGNGEVFTWLFTDTLRAVDGITNRVV